MSEVRPAGAAAFADAPPEGVSAALFYGPNRGLARELARRLVSSLLGGALSDPFRLARLTGAEAAEPGRLFEEARAAPFGGGRRVVWVEGDAERAAAPLSALVPELASGALGAGPDAPFVVAEAGELRRRARLVEAFAAPRAAAAVGCWEEDARSLARLASEALSERGVEAGEEATAALAARLSPDRALARRELERLALLAGAGGALSPAEVEAEAVDFSGAGLEDLAFAVASGDPAAARRALARRREERDSAVALLRAAARHLGRLAEARAAAPRAGGIREAAGALRPPVFWKRLPAFAAQARALDGARLEEALSRVVRAEAEAKSGGAPADALAARRLMEVAALLGGPGR